MSQDQQFQSDQDQEFLSSFDLEKFKMILRESWVFLVLFVSITGTAAYLYVRYTPQTFESSSVIKLNFESEASMLNISSPAIKQEGEISGEIELLKSRLFFSKVIEAIDMDVSYYRYGRVLDSERFRVNPFDVSYKIKNGNYNNRPIDIEILDDKSFQLEYDDFSETFRFDEEISRPEFNLLVTKTKYFGSGAKGRYYFIVNTPEAQIEYLVNGVKVIPESFTAKTLKISLQSLNQRKARLLVQTIDSVYEIYTREAKNRALEQKIEFLDERIKATEEILQKFENYFENFTIQNRSTNLGNDLRKTITELDKLDSTYFNLKARQSDIELLKKQLESEKPLLLNVILIEKFPSSIMDLLNEYQKGVQTRIIKRSSYSESTFIIQQLNEELKLLQTHLLAVVNAYTDNIKTNLANVLTRKTILESSLNQLPVLETEYTKNKRFYGQQEEFMLSLRRAKMEIEITKAGTVTDIVVLSPASYPFTPVQPEKMLIYALGAISGLMIGLLFLLIRYLLNSEIMSITELERLISLPILGSVPFYKQEKLPATKLVIRKDSKSSLSESLRTIRTNMEFMNGTSNKHIISISSTVSGEGKTFLGVNLGGIIALSGQKICVVDIDMRKPKIHLSFGKSESVKGVSTILSGRSKVMESVESTSIENFFYLPAGPVPPNPSELLLGESFNNLLRDLQKEFDVVILDTPPVGLVTDGILVMKKADLQLYVIRSGYSKRDYIKTLENLKKTGQFNKLAIIFNSLNSSSAYGYGYGYGYYDEGSKKA